MINEKMKNYEDILEMWKTHEPFVDEDDIPDIPVVSKEDYINIIIPNIIRCGGIPKSELVIGKTYVGSCRNASEATDLPSRTFTTTTASPTTRPRIWTSISETTSAIILA